LEPGGDEWRGAASARLKLLLVAYTHFSSAVERGEVTTPEEMDSYTLFTVPLTYELDDHVVQATLKEMRGIAGEPAIHLLAEFFDAFFLVSRNRITKSPLRSDRLGVEFSQSEKNRLSALDMMEGGLTNALKSALRRAVDAR